jgi:hypothetical protein
MKGSCFFCNRFTGSSSGPEAKILCAQLECIENGFLSAAEVIQAEVNKIFEVRNEANSRSRKKAYLLDPGEERQILAQISEIVSRIATNKNGEKEKPVKNTFKLRDGLVRDFLKNYLVSSTLKLQSLFSVFS